MEERSCCSKQSDYDCVTCNEKFEDQSMLREHRLNKCPGVPCPDCGKQFLQRRDLEKHHRSREKVCCGHCDRVFCNIFEYNKHQRDNKANREVTEDECTEEVIQPNLYYNDPGYQEEKRKNYGKIKNDVEKHKNYTVYNKEISPNFTYGDLLSILEEIFDKQTKITKYSIAFGYILHNQNEGEFKYNYASSNNELFEKPFTISNHDDLKNFYRKIVAVDMISHYYLTKPSSSWTMAGLTNVSIYTYPIIDAPIGSAIELPDYILKNKHIYALVKDKKNSHQLDDNNCFWRCLALHNEAKISALERPSKYLREEFEKSTGYSYENGVTMMDLEALEHHFKISIHVYNLKEKGVVDVLRVSKLDYPKMYLNLFQNHFSFIKDFSKYAQTYCCGLCQRPFKNHQSAKRHIIKCNVEITEKYRGGKYRGNKSIFERMDSVGIVVPKEKRFCPWYSTYDFESIQIKQENVIHGRTIVGRHEAASFSTHSNLQGHQNPVHKTSDGDPQKLVDNLVKENLKQQKTFSKLMRERYDVYITELDEKIEDLEKEVKPTRKRKLGVMLGETLNPTEKENSLKVKKLEKLKSIKNSFDQYCDQLICIGFNSSSYDVPLIKNFLPSSLAKHDQLPQFVIKKNGGYMVLASQRLKYLDLMNYVAAGTSLDDLYKAHGVSVSKSAFPYQWFTSLDKLKEKGLPTQRQFHSTLTNKGIDHYTYMKSWRIYHENGMKKFGDYVKFYNNNDVVGLTEVIADMMGVYNEKGLDPFKEAISLPGLCQRYLFKNLKEDEYFVSFGEEHKDLYKLFKNSIVGGPSIIFTRYHEKGKTKIRRGEKFCQKIKGYDSNSLYLWCLGQLMPTGHYSRRVSPDFKRETRFSQESLQWLTWVAKEKNIDIRHALNGGEVRIQNYLIDGFDEKNNTVYSYYGCYWHGHHCNQKYDIEKWEKTLKREQHLRDLGYNVESITSCEWKKIPESKIWYQVDESDGSTKDDILEQVKNDKLFGFVRCDIHVPENLIPRFSDFPPIFKNCEISLDDIGEHMQRHCEDIGRKSGIKRALIGSMRGDDILLLTPLLKEYLRLGLVVDNIHEVIEFNGKAVFSGFMDEIIDERRKADLDPAFKVKGLCAKFFGNCGYGRTLLDKYKFTRTTFVEDENVPAHIKDPFFKSVLELNNGLHEVQKGKRSVNLDNPLQIGLAVYNYAKLKMIQFWDFLDTYLQKDSFELMEMDTDSLYLAISEDNLDDCVKEDMKAEWFQAKLAWFPSEDQTEMNFEGYTITKAQYSMRKAALFKEEFSGDGMVCLNSKVYIGYTYADGNESKKIKKSKISCKGIQKKRNKLVKDQFLYVLKNEKPLAFENSGFVKYNKEGTIILTYTQKKNGLGYFYGKRKIMDDGISSTHLDI